MKVSARDLKNVDAKLVMVMITNAELASLPRQQLTWLEEALDPSSPPSRALVALCDAAHTIERRWDDE